MNRSRAQGKVTQLLHVYFRYIAAFPAVSIGSKTIKSAATMNKDADTNMGPFALLAAAVPDAPVAATLMTGARIPVIRLKLLARASPVPRWGAGNTSGV